MSQKKEKTITYDELSEIVREERKDRTKITVVGPDFYDLLSRYFLGIKLAYEQIQKTSTCFSSKIAEEQLHEYQSAKALIMDLVDRRSEKLAKYAVIDAVKGRKSLDPSLFPHKEIVLYTKLKELLKKFRDDILMGVLDTKPSKSSVRLSKDKIPLVDSHAGSLKRNQEFKNIKGSYVSVKVLHRYPRFTGTDLKTYGPLDIDSKIKLPLRDAMLLVKKGIVEMQRGGRNENSS
jgi:DNA replication initiation complex subunit (GINS family)